MKIVLIENCVEHSANFILYKGDGDLWVKNWTTWKTKRKKPNRSSVKHSKSDSLPKSIWNSWLIRICGIHHSFYSGVVNTQKLVSRSHHINFVGLSFGTLFVHENWKTGSSCGCVCKMTVIIRKSVRLKTAEPTLLIPLSLPTTLPESFGCGSIPANAVSDFLDWKRRMLIHSAVPPLPHKIIFDAFPGTPLCEIAVLQTAR